MESSTKFQDMNDGSDDDFRYLIVRPENARIWDLMRYYYLWADIESGVRFLESSDQVSWVEKRLITVGSFWCLS